MEIFFFKKKNIYIINIERKCSHLAFFFFFFFFFFVLKNLLGNKPYPGSGKRLSLSVVTPYGTNRASINSLTGTLI